MSTAFVFVFCLSAKCHKVCLYRQKRQISWKSSHTVFMGSPCFRWKLLSLLFTNLSSDARPFHIPDGIDAPHPLYLSRAFIEIKQTNKQALLCPLYLFRSLPHNFSNAPLSIPCHTWLNSPPPHKPISKKNIYFIFFQATLSVGS